MTNTKTTDQSPATAVDSNVIAFPSSLGSEEYDQLTRHNQVVAANRQAEVGRKVAAMVQHAETRPDRLLQDHIEQTVLRVKHGN